MNKFTDQIDKALKQFSTEATFSAEAMQQFMKLKDLASEQEAKIQELSESVVTKEKRLSEKYDEVKTHLGNIKLLQQEVAEWLNRESDLKTREGNCLRNELAAEYSHKRVEDHQTMVGLIFRNTELRKTSFGQELTHQPGSPEMKDQYGNTQQCHTPAGFEATPVKKDEIETQE